MKVSQLTTHVLDTSVGKPGKDITIQLKHANDEIISQGVTNADGRIPDLLPSEKYLVPGNYKMVFDTANYFKANNTKGFYPEVEIQFTVFDDSHYHVPLLINPYGYSTYRGS
ncbi:MAG: hydroxyisourate hydrolase [Sphingobacteriales bacterium]|nr:hydroxyisourate hydrolase [Sphingobacteriales bacterium]